MKESRQKIILARCALVAACCCAFPMNSVQAQSPSYSDNFEGASLNPFWRPFQASGVLTFPSTAQSHSGSQSVEFTTIPAGVNMEVQLNHDFASPVYGRVSMWVYDGSADQGSGNYHRFYLLIPGGGGYEIMIFTQDFDLGPNNGGNYNFNVPGPSGPITYNSGIDRTKGWHHFEITSIPTLLEYRIDGQIVHSSSTGYQFRGITFSLGSAAFRPGVTSYVDDFDFAQHQDLCLPGTIFANVLLPEAFIVPDRNDKNCPTRVRFAPLGLNFTVQSTTEPGTLCEARSNSGALQMFLVCPDGQELLGGFSTTQATLTLFRDGTLRWQASGFEVIMRGIGFSPPDQCSLGPRTDSINIITDLGLDPMTTPFEAVVRAAEPLFHQRLSTVIEADPCFNSRIGRIAKWVGKKLCGC